jgi:hypothetical protein
MSSTQRFLSKVAKRIRQVGRLGPNGIARTAYICTVAPSFYILTDPARALAARLHRHRVLHRALESRIKNLKQRAAGIAQVTGPAVRHDFATNLARFVLTLEALFDLKAAGCAVPRVVGIDWASQVIWVEEIESASIPMSATLAEQALQAIHCAGYAVGRIVPNDVAVTSAGAPVVLNLRGAVPLAGLCRDMSIHLRDSDRQHFNELFGTRLLTAVQLRAMLSPSARIPRDRVHDTYSEVYAPAVIRDDIRWGKIWNTDLGSGRWNFIMNEHLPIPVGGTVLDLGTNNGFNPLQMLRSGAASAVGIEISEKEIEQAMFLKSAYEWLDNRLYDFRCIHGSQGDLPKFDLPAFDVVTALCSLYYLPESNICELVRYIRTRTGVLVMQCNTDRLIDRGRERTGRKASVEFAVEVMDQAGFAYRQIVAPPGYSRPLVIGRTWNAKFP